MLKALWRLHVWIATGSIRLYKRLQTNRELRKSSTDDPRPDVNFDPACSAIEAIHQFANARSSRIIGLVGVDHDSGVTSAAIAVAVRYARGDKRTLLIEATGLASASPEPSDQQILASRPSRDRRGFDRVALRPSVQELLPMRDIARLRTLFNEEFSSYQVIIIDIPPVRDTSGHALPATIIANACETVLLICLTATVTRTLIEDACSALRAVNAPIAAIIINRREQPTLGDEIAREARRFRNRFPKTAAKIEHRALAADILNVHACPPVRLR